MELGPDEKRAIATHIEGFKKYLEGADAKEILDAIAERTKLFKKVLAPENLPRLSEEEFSSVIMELWAMNFWGNKKYKVSQLLQDNGLPLLRSELGELIYGGGDIAKRYDRFRNNVKGFGPAMLTEILTTMSPDKYCLWNQKPINIIPYLKMSFLLPESVFKGQLTGTDYATALEVMKLVRNELRENGVVGVGSEVTPGFWTTDLFMWYLWDEKGDEIRKTPEGPEEERAEDDTDVDATWTHNDAQAVLLELGNLLGYDTYTADPGKEPQGVLPEGTSRQGSRIKVGTGESRPGLARNPPLGEIATLDQVPTFAPERVC